MSLDKNMKLEFSSAITNLTSKNASFDSGFLRIAYTGKNRNGSFISKESFEKAIPSMYGVPVVANYMREMDEIGSHDGEFVDKDGTIEYVNITQPVGFVPPNAKYWWETLEDDGVIHQYLNTEVIIWKRQEAYDKIKENVITKHSMEISVSDGEMKDDYYEIYDFEFTAFCLLGTAEPCFESSALFTFDKQEMQEQFDEMLKEFKLAFSSDPATKEVDSQMDKLHELLKKYNVAEEDLEFSYEGMSDEELEAKFVEIYEKTEPNEPEISEPNAGSEEPKDNFALNSQLIDSIRNVLRSELVDDDGYSYPRYWFCDFDVEKSEVYFEDALDEWKLYGTTFSLDGDDVVVDLDNKKRKKYAIVDYVEGTAEANFSLSDVITEIKQQAKNKYDLLDEKYQELIQKQHKEEVDKLFEKFEEKLSDVAEFKLLKSDFAKYSVEEIEEKLFSLVGRKQFKYTPKNTKSPKAPAIPTTDFSLEDKPEEYEPYGDLFDFVENK